MVLCGFCDGFALSIGREYSGEYYLHQPSLEALLRSSNECELCRLIANQFDETNLRDSILSEAKEGNPTTITFVGIDRNGPWKYYPQHLNKCLWNGLVGLMVCCGETRRSDNWSCDFGLFTNQCEWAQRLVNVFLHNFSPRACALCCFFKHRRFAANAANGF